MRFTPLLITPLLLLGCAHTPKPAIGSFGFDTSGMDRSVAPGDDFYQYANGTWAKTTEIPADKSNYGVFTTLADLNTERINALLSEAATNPGDKVGDLYASYLDSERVEALGLEPIQPWLARIDGARDHAELLALTVPALERGIAGLVAVYIGQDDKDPDHYITHWYQNGTGLPDRDMYLGKEARFETIRTAYLEHLTRMLHYAGRTDARARAEALLDFETRIAKAHWPREDSSDASKTYNKLSAAEARKLLRASPLADALLGMAPDIDAVIAAQPSALAAIASLAAAAPLPVLKDAMLVRSLETYAEVLPDAVDSANFAFYGTVLSGIPEREPRWKRAVKFTEIALGDELGKAYVEKYFPPATKAAMEELVDNVIAAMGRRIDQVEWMEPATKQRARQKLANFTPKIGYPERWKDYTDLSISRDDLFGNHVRARAWRYRDQLAKLGEDEIRRWEWGMLPQTVNAYANFSMNEIVFPAAILQPPFFDPAADPAINYGAIGAVIGHEISHHFDDQGAKYDENGRLADWWTEQDREAFEAAGKALVAQYDQYEPLPGQFIKGEFTLGENIGDLAGLTVAYDAYRASLDGQEAPVLDGFTGDQRFFLSWAQVWRRNYREAELSQRLITDPHSPSIQRAWIVRNLDPWVEAFEVPESARLYLPPEQRVKIW